MKLNVSLETRKFSFHHMFNALQWNEVSHEYLEESMLHVWALAFVATQKIVKN